MKQYQINFKRWASMLLPMGMRMPMIRLFLDALLAPISKLHDSFIRNRDQNIQRLTVNGQVCHIRGMLNRQLDGDAKRIEIKDAATEGDWCCAWTEELTNHLLVGPETWLYSEALIIANTAYFMVKVPWKKENKDKEVMLCSLLNEYKLLSKKYLIEYGNE